MRGILMDKRSVAKIFSNKYTKASKKMKSIILDDFTNLMGYNRTYAACLLRNPEDIKPRIIINKYYGKEVEKTLVQIWKIMDYICGQRLKPILPDIVEKLEQFYEQSFSLELKEKLYKISSSTIDRILGPHKRKLGRRKRTFTTPGNFLKKQIPIRTYGKWPEKGPGFLEIDLVSHEGGDNSGEYYWTLNCSDINMAWTTSILIKGKGQQDVLDGIKCLALSLPFAIKGIDCDNGSEFINYLLLEYCKDHNIKFTRARPYKKNDNCYVEQKNYSVVRRNVGYLRYNTQEEFEIITQLYSYLDLYNNFFQPSKKLIEKTKVASRYIRRYRPPETPYKRILNCPTSLKITNEWLKEIYKSLNPIELKNKINQLQDVLIEITKHKKETFRNYLDKDDLYRLARYHKRNQPSKNNPSIFVEKMSNQKAIESEEEKKATHRKLIDGLGKSRKVLRDKNGSGSEKRLAKSGKKNEPKKEDVIKSLQAWIAGYEAAKLKLVKKGKYDEAKKKDDDIQRIQEEINKLKGKSKKDKQSDNHDKTEDDKLGRLKKCVGIIENQRKKE